MQKKNSDRIAKIEGLFEKLKKGTGRFVAAPYTFLLWDRTDIENTFKLFEKYNIN